MRVRKAEKRPQVVVIEDLHWIDGVSEQFLTTLTESVPALRALLVFTYRPGYASPFGERSYFTRGVPAAVSRQERGGDLRPGRGAGRALPRGECAHRPGGAVGRCAPRGAAGPGRGQGGGQPV